MSGGVDSSVAAARLVQRGYDVLGVTLHLWDEPPGTRGRCCAPEDVRDARRVADALGIAHYSLDRREQFLRNIVEPFVDDYLSGRTPSPCVRCNQQIKFPALMRLASMVGARWVATGHYARVVRVGEWWRVAQGVDRVKDQSYFLYGLGQAELERLMLPLSDSLKPEVRDQALKLGLAGAQKGESQDLCFVHEPTYAEFVERYAPNRVRPGPIVNAQGQRLGSHGGIHRFTVGQRKGVGVCTGQPAFVTRLDPSTGTVVVGDERALACTEVRVANPKLAAGLQLPMRATVRVRYRHEGAAATLMADGSQLRIVFETPVRAASLGQVAVAFDGAVVVGGGPITEVLGAVA